MQPRIITRTHYQVDEPAYLIALILNCTSPVQSDYRDRVASRLTELVRAWGRRFNDAAAAYAIDFARGLGLLTENLVWTEMGQLIRLVSAKPRIPELEQETLAERILLFRLFLERDGAALGFLVRSALATNGLPPRGQTWNDLANEMALSVYREYLDVASDLTDRTRIRGMLDRRRAQPFSGKSGSHQIFIHLQSLYRMGLLTRETSAQTRRYEVRRDVDAEPLAILVETIPNADALETVVKMDQCLGVAASVFSWDIPKTSVKETGPTGEQVFRELLANYRNVTDTGVAICPLRPLVEAAIIKRISTGRYVLGYNEALELLQTFQRAYPREIRFHVDNMGMPAYLKVDDGFVL